MIEGNAAFVSGLLVEAVGLVLVVAVESALVPEASLPDFRRAF
jgi:hypothetical protein